MNQTDCFYFNSLKYIKFESNKLTKNFSQPIQSQLNCIGGDACKYSKYLNYIDCYNVNYDSTGHILWHCYPDKFFNYYLYPKLIDFSSFDIQCDNCQNSLYYDNKHHANYVQDLIYSYNYNTIKVNSSCILNYKMHKIETNTTLKVSNNSISMDNKNIYFVVKCTLIILSSSLFAIIFCKILVLFYDYYKKNKKSEYIKLTNKDFENVVLINNNSYQNEHKNMEIV